jgi:apolipoprotein D and lipocalin family protein
MSGCSGARPSDTQKLESVARVDLPRYFGKWYEIARFPAEYTIQDDGKVSVLNSCRDAKTGALKEVKGVAEVDDPRTNAKLKVSFVPGFLRWLGIGRGDYWVIDLASDYSYSVVSEPSRKYLWILSREPEMSKGTLDGILRRLESNHFDTRKLIDSRTEKDGLRGEAA